MNKPSDRYFLGRTVLSLPFLFGVFLGCFCFLSLKAQATVVSPARLEVEGDPGEIVAGKCSVINDSETAQTYYSSTENFEADGETGNPRFVESEDGLAEWIEVPDKIVVEPKERKEISFAISVPKDAGVGGHFAALFWGNQPVKNKEDGAVTVGQKVGVLVFLRVRGKVVEKGEIADFGTLKNDKFFDSLPVDMFFRFTNSGNDRLKPLGEVVITNIFGARKEEIVANKKQGSVLPESVRKFYLSWGRENVEELEKKGGDIAEANDPFFLKVKKQFSNFAFGKYTAELKLKYGTGQEEVKSRYSFYVFPWQLLSLVAALFLTFALGGRALVKKYNRWIVNQSRK